MTALQPASIPGAPDEGLAVTQRPQRRKREELEALAADFVNSKIHTLPPAAARIPRKAALAAGGAVLLAVVAWLLWPAGESVPVREQAPAVNEAEVWAKRLEAERERKRQDLQHSREFLAKMAAADSALLDDLAARAQNLEARPEAAPASVQRELAAEPSPKDVAANAGPAKAPVPAPPQAQVPVQAQPKASSQAVTKPAPAQAAAAGKAEAPPAAKEVQVAAAPKCSIHVSELSSSGKLTYADIARMKGARTDGAGHVFTPPVRAANGRNVVFEVATDGCVRVVR